jgi:hypothetical protein
MTPTEEQLTGATVGIVPIEPWDFVTENGQGPFTARVLKTTPTSGETERAVLLRLDSPLQFNGVMCKYFVGRPRHERGPATEILSNRPTAFNLTCIPEDRATERTPLTSVGGAEASL